MKMWLKERETVIFVLLLCGPILGRPGQLREQRYEFRDIQETISIEPTNNQIMGVQVAPVQHGTISWSQQHQNEVIAFAEAFRQNYNRIIQQHNSFMQNLLAPVPYQFYHLPSSFTWNQFFGNQEEFVQQQSEQMSRQLIDNLQHGKITQQDIMQPDFFIHQAANELDKIHFHDNYTPLENAATDNIHEVAQQEEMLFDTERFGSNEQHEYQLSVPDDLTRHQFESTFMEDQQHHKHFGMEDQNTQTHIVDHTVLNERNVSYIQSLPPIRFNNSKIERVDKDFENLIDQFDGKPTPKTSKITQPPIDYYANTYDQQSIYDLQMAEEPSTTTPKADNVKALIRKRISKPHVNSEYNSTFRSADSVSSTTSKSETASNVMSMLPHKAPSLNYSEIYEKVREDLDKKLKQLTDTRNEETHFMGLTSNTEHEKLSYDIVTTKKTTLEDRGDQPVVESEDYVIEDMFESEPGIGNYPVIATKPMNVRPVGMNIHYEASLAPLPTTTIRSNPYYSAQLAAYPTVMQPIDDQQLQVHQHASELEEMGQETETLDAEAYIDLNVPHDRNIQLNNQYESHGTMEEFYYQQHVDTQQYEDEQQSLTNNHHELIIPQQLQEGNIPKQTRPEQQYHNPDMQIQRHEGGTSEMVMELATQPSASTKGHQKNWFQRQFSKIFV
ncbi:uncharacterized protein LOC131432975 isoform X2 [Malaya genurostris]|uniref:uncharacterized protein LOC131432975 isoform X2 n=1 Tax=Malaya genurostris TaxID=325434 RepID=UPI0026F39D63|nr:uncharacterized protein LOC131432975 isoform X2 [Malaya genurostris]